MGASDGTESSDDTESSKRWSLLGLGGAVSLCCLFAAPAAGGAVSGTVAGGATAALGGGVVRILVSALTVGAIGAALRYRTRGCECGCDADACET
ncbi:hypothetical protein DVK02_11820 [Halobellus sp. Atlit-31R]|nr:hypothetical protein DVK02_11820 [Halobellus sp. Atlit-31R]